MSSETSLYIYDDESFKDYMQDHREYRWWQQKVKREKKLIAAVAKNNAKALKRLLNSRKLYYVVDKDGYSLLQMAVELDSRKCFDYILSLPDFPLNIPGKKGQTALISAIKNIGSMCWNSKKLHDDRPALQLIKKGADIFCQDYLGRTPLMYAAFKNHVKMAAIFIQNGIDLNVQDGSNETALHIALGYGESITFEFVALLLCNGADLSLEDKDGFNAFETAVFHCKNSLLQEILFYYTYDCYTEMITYYNVLLRLAQNHQSFLLNSFDNVSEVHITPFGCHTDLFSIDDEFLSILVKKFKSDVLKTIISESNILYLEHDFPFDRIDVFLNSEFREHTISQIHQNERGDKVIEYIKSFCYDENTTAKIMCYLLSYGLEISEEALQIVYEKFGRCELFNMLLHMDFEKNSECNKQIMPTLLYDVHFTLEEYLKNPGAFSEEDVDRLLCYFNNTELKELCCRVFGDQISSRITNLPQVPLLKELARNVFRKYFIERFQIKNSRRFYTLLTGLDISDVYKKIIAYDTVLY